MQAGVVAQAIVDSRVAEAVKLVAAETVVEVVAVQPVNSFVYHLPYKKLFVK